MAVLLVVQLKDRDFNAEPDCPAIHFNNLFHDSLEEKKNIYKAINDTMHQNQNISD